MKKVPLAHIKGEQIIFLAEQGGCTYDYVLRILKGRRAVNSPRARVIYKAAKLLNQAIENGRQRAKRELIIIGEND